MKICYLANTAIPSTNASSIQIVKMCEAFSALKNHVTFAISYAKNIGHLQASFLSLIVNFSSIVLKILNVLIFLLLVLDEFKSILLFTQSAGNSVQTVTLGHS